MVNTFRNATLCFLLQEIGGKPSSICLAMKKRGFGKGRWNGTGGKVEKDETIEQTAIRETQEEIGVTPKEVKKVATLTFLFPHNSDWSQIVHVYITNKWEGEPKESEEMQPRWFRLSDIPYNSMWADDEIWLPQVLTGNNIRATFTFGEGDVILSHELAIVEDTEL